MSSRTRATAGSRRRPSVPSRPGTRTGAGQAASPAPGRPVVGGSAAPDGSYRWVALAIITLGSLMVFINQSIVLIALPAIFRGIGLDPLTPANTGYMLWMLMGFSVVLAVLVVTLGRVGDMFGRVRMYTLGFAVFTVFSLLLS
jgi:MFS family permease